MPKGLLKGDLKGSQTFARYLEILCFRKVRSLGASSERRRKGVQERRSLSIWLLLERTRELRIQSCKTGASKSVARRSELQALE